MTEETNQFANEGEFRGGERGTAIISGVTFQPRAVIYSRVGGMAIFEGDIALGTVEQLEQSLEDTRNRALSDPTDVAFGVGISGARFRWPAFRVPFRIDPNLPNQQRVRDAIAHWEANTPLRFPERTPANAAEFPNFVEFMDAGGCWSMVGMQAGPQTISLGVGCSTGNAIHEIGHAVGLWHEQSREDRDRFVSINWANIQTGMGHNFDQHIADGDDFNAYDYGSIMHYPRTAFSRNGQETITPTDANAQIGQRQRLSAGDIAAVLAMYPTAGRQMIADFSSGQVPATVRYWEDWGRDPLFDGWQDDNDWTFVGDFMHLGYDQLLSVNRAGPGSGGRIMIADFSSGQVPATVRYWEDWGRDPLFDGWQDDNDWTFVGDFMHLGYDQLLSVNRAGPGSGGRIMIADFSSGQVPATVRYWEDWGRHPLFDGWQDDNDWTFVGDFMHLGYDQLLLVNRAGPGSGGRIMIADFSSGQVPATVRYWEDWGRHPLFDGWQDDNDWTFVGDFMHLGYDQLLSVNRAGPGSGGRIMIADFSSGQIPATVRYWEDWGRHPLFDGWQDDNDWTFVGDFMHLGYDQLLLVNRAGPGSGGRIMIADFSSGQIPATVRYWEDWGRHPLFDGWQDDNDGAFVGDFSSSGYATLLSRNASP